MTAKKPNPAKRGRKQMEVGVREKILVEWYRFTTEKLTTAPQTRRRDLARAFIEDRRDFLKAIGLVTGDYGSLRNVLRTARKERRQRRAYSWGFVTDLRGNRSYSTNAALLRRAQMVALGIVPK